jgi:hypothetical protein
MRLATRYYGIVCCGVKYLHRRKCMYLQPKEMFWRIFSFLDRFKTCRASGKIPGIIIIYEII